MATIKEYLSEMREQGKTPHFTNIPGAAQPDSFAYDEDEFTAETERQLGTPGTGFDYTPESLREGPEFTPESMPETKGKMPKKPPDSLLEPGGQRDFKDRQKYSKFVVDKMGFDPYSLDFDKEVEKAQEALPDVFEAAFGGQVLWRDRDKLDKKQQDHWNAAHKAFNVHVRNSVKEKAVRGKEEYKSRMKIFEDKLAEKKALPAAMEKSLGSIFISVDESGKKIGKIPAGILSKANKDAEQLINTGNMTGPEAIEKVTNDLVRERLRISAIDDALAAIPEMKKGWLSDDAKNVENVKSIIKDALEQGVDRKEVEARLKKQGWDAKNIAKVFPKETDKIETPDKTVGAQQYKTPEDIRSAFKSGAITRDQAKQYLRQTMS